MRWLSLLAAHTYVPYTAPRGCNTSLPRSYVAIFATYLVDASILWLRCELATRNIAAKTLLDDRFLL